VENFNLVELVNYLHKNGLSHVASVLAIFLDSATDQQKRAMLDSISEWYYSQKYRT
jgi:hypothetical protein